MFSHEIRIPGGSERSAAVITREGGMMKIPVCSQVLKETGPHLMVFAQLFGLLFSREETENNGSMSPPSLPETVPLVLVHPRAHQSAGSVPRRRSAEVLVRFCCGRSSDSERRLLIPYSNE